MALLLFYLLQVVVRFHVSLWPCSTGRFCGGQPPSLILIGGSHSITVQFVSDVSSRGAGFAIQFSGVDKDYSFGELNLSDWFLLLLCTQLWKAYSTKFLESDNNSCGNLKIRACLVTVQWKCRISCAAIQYSTDHHALHECLEQHACLLCTWLACSHRPDDVVFEHCLIYMSVYPYSPVIKKRSTLICSP